GSDPFPMEQIAAVNKVIGEIAEDTGESAPPEILVINKVDQADPLVLAELRSRLDDVLFVSAHTGEGIAALESRLELFLNSRDEHVVLQVPFDRGEVVSRLHEYGTVLNQEYTELGTRVEVRLPGVIAAELADLRIADDRATE
ncbi:MAG: GTPase HflX, partial [Corynebacterium sp.]|nr:GTPase HflX [Corynebacterium sp.]